QPIIADRLSILHKVFFLDDFKNRQRRCGGKIVSAKRCSQHSAPRCDVRVYQHAPYGETVAHPFGRSNQVRLYTGMLVCKELAGPTISGLYFIEYQKRAVSSTLGFEMAEKLVIGDANAPNSLDAFKNHCRYFVVHYAI